VRVLLDIGIHNREIQLPPYVFNIKEIYIVEKQSQEVLEV